MSIESCQAMPSTRSVDTAKRRQQQKMDLRRMQYRRAIEDFVEQRQLNRELADFPDWITAQAASERAGTPRRSA